MTRPPVIGIVCGSGPEAGMDLWQKVLAERRRQFGSDYRGDVDAPRVVVVSEPELGWSMQLPDPAVADRVRAALQRAVASLAPCVDRFAIACNTLHVFEDEVRAAGHPAKLVSYVDVVGRWCREQGIARLGLLAARPVLDLSGDSPFARLRDEIDLVAPDALDTEVLHRLIEDVKRRGSADAEAHRQLTAIAHGIGVDQVLLACTELPLVAGLGPLGDVDTIDLTSLVAAALLDPPA